MRIQQRRAVRIRVDISRTAPLRVSQNDLFACRNASASAAPQVFSWDTSKNGPRTDDSKGRSYISAVSEVTTGESCSGKAKKNMGEARMDIEDSEMAYLGYHGAESYGLTWKVGGQTFDYCGGP